MHQEEDQDENVQIQEQPKLYDEPKQSNIKTYLILMIIIIYNLIFGYYYIKKSINGKNISISKERNSECYYLGNFSFYYGEILVYIAIFSLFIIIPCTCRPCINQEYSDNLFRVIVSFELTQQIFFLIALSIAFSYNEQCGKLNKFVFVYLAINLSILFFGISILIWIIIHSSDINIFATVQSE